MTMLSPAFAPEDLTTLLVVPSIVQETTIRLTASENSVCPPTISTPRASAVSCASFINLPTSSADAVVGAIIVRRQHKGVPPDTATSFADTVIARRPALLPVAVMGSVVRSKFWGSECRAIFRKPRRLQDFRIFATVCRIRILKFRRSKFAYSHNKALSFTNY